MNANVNGSRTTTSIDITQLGWTYISCTILLCNTGNISSLVLSNGTAPPIGRYHWPLYCSRAGCQNRPDPRSCNIRHVAGESSGTFCFRYTRLRTGAVLNSVLTSTDDLVRLKCTELVTRFIAQPPRGSDWKGGMVGEKRSSNFILLRFYTGNKNVRALNDIELGFYEHYTIADGRARNRGPCRRYTSWRFLTTYTWRRPRSEPGMFEFIEFLGMYFGLCIKMKKITFNNQANTRICEKLTLKKKNDFQHYVCRTFQKNTVFWIFNLNTRYIHVCMYKRN